MPDVMYNTAFVFAVGLIIFQNVLHLSDHLAMLSTFPAFEFHAQNSPLLALALFWRGTLHIQLYTRLDVAGKQLHM